MHQEIKKEIARQMEAAGLRFNVESVEDYFDKLGDAADYIRQVYDDCATVGEKVEAWLDDTRRDCPGELISFENAETPA